AGKVIADEQSNSIVIEDVPQRVKQLGDYIKAIDIPTETKVYKLQYAAVEMVADKIKEMVSPKIGSVKFDASSNKLFIKDAPKKLKEMDDFVKQIDNPRETRVFQVSYAKAEDLARTITPMLTKDIGNLQFDARSNTVVLTDIPPKIKAIEAVIEALDKNDKEVLIEAKIVQITLSDGYQMGINWEKFWPSAAHKVLTLKNDFSLSSTPSPVSVTTVGTLDRDGYAAVLQLIATFGKSRLLSNPRIAVVNRQEARILVGDNTPYVTSSTTTPATGAPVTAETVNFIDTGVKLHVTPVIHDDGYISMKIKPEVSNIPKTVTTGSKNEIPVVNTSEVETTIRVKDGVTIIIGGLIKDEVKNNRNKIPVLGDIPLVGKAFRSETRSTAKTEIVIFLTPHIISGDVRADPDTYSHPTIKPGKTYYSPVQDPSEGLVP
ncbi:MAG: type II secretion system protein GspD, partial [Candidatus Omnitrophica bacterium]|nr:type II secretion system protein GspD [Candidatus Omnitrophota bacterium]